MSFRRFQQPQSRPCPALPSKSRFAVRREELQKQEQLLLEKKKEVEAKLNCGETVATNSAESSSASTAAIADPSPQTAAADQKVKCEPIANKFQNNGSFLELFREMQRKSGESELVNEKQDEVAAQLIPQSSSSACSDESDKLEAIEQCATFVAMNGSGSEAILKERFSSSDNYKWLMDEKSMDYKYYEHRVGELRSVKAEADGDEETGRGKKRKKSRWGSASDALPLDADLMQYAMQVFGTVQLEERQWRQLQDQRNMRILTRMTWKRLDQVQYEYDSDEEVDGGTWEHKRRMQEMEKTRERAEILTAANEGKTHIGDFLPPDELSRFLRQWDKIRNGKAPGSLTDDYEQFKITSENTGFKMMQQMGWQEGETLGKDSRSGISEPIRLESTSEHRGLGVAAPSQLEEGDDEFEAYRKRMMFAYRFRPNPLVAPLRPYAGMDPVHDLVQSFQSCYDVSLSALSPHPHRLHTLYKNSGRTKLDRQNERRRERLARQKEKRAALLSSRRDSDTVSASDIAEVMDVWDADDEVMDCSQPERRRKRTRVYADILILSEWMVQVPENFAAEWLLIVCPIGKRCAVVSSQGRTRSFARNGFEFLTKFPSLLPGGNGNARGSAKQNAILDCIYSESEKTFFILDVILWNGVSFYGCETDFRFFWLDSKKSDLLPASDLSTLNKFMFKRLPHFPCSKPQIAAALTDVSFESGVDGCLFLHRECGYAAGVTPLAGWLKKEMVQDMLLQEDTECNKEGD